jgi:hypothetical protein
MKKHCSITLKKDVGSDKNLSPVEKGAEKKAVSTAFPWQFKAAARLRKRCACGRRAGARGQ